MIKEINKIGYKCISEPTSIPMIEHFSGSDRFIASYRTIRNIINIATRRNEVMSMIRGVSPDIVAVNSMTISYTGKMAKSLGIKSVCFHRETYAKGLFGVRTKIIKRLLSIDFDKVVFISSYDLEQSDELKSDTYIIHDKVIINEYIDQKDNNVLISISSEEIIKVLYTGGMSELKGAHIIIKALANCNPNIYLIFLQYDGIKRKTCLADYKGIKNKLRYILGKDYTSKVLSLIEKNSLWNRIHFYPVTNDVAKFFKLCDLVVFPSTSAHQARPIYESGAASKPIIITKSENISEFVVDGENGFTFENGNSVILSELVDKLAKDKDLRKKMGNINYTKTINNHDFATLKNELSLLFEVDLE